MCSVQAGPYPGLTKDQGGGSLIGWGGGVTRAIGAVST